MFITGFQTVWEVPELRPLADQDCIGMERAGDQPPWPKYSHTKGLEEQHLTHVTDCMRKVGNKTAFEICNERELSHLFSRTRTYATPRHSPRPGTLPGVRLDHERAAKKARVETTKCLSTKPEKPAAQQETEEEPSSIAAISLFTVKESTVLTSSIQNQF